MKSGYARRLGRLAAMIDHKHAANDQVRMVVICPEMWPADAQARYWDVVAACNVTAQDDVIEEQTGERPAFRTCRIIDRVPAPVSIVRIHAPDGVLIR